MSKFLELVCWQIAALVFHFNTQSNKSFLRTCPRQGFPVITNNFPPSLLASFLKQFRNVSWRRADNMEHSAPGLIELPYSLTMLFRVVCASEYFIVYSLERIFGTSEL